MWSRRIIVTCSAIVVAAQCLAQGAPIQVKRKTILNEIRIVDGSEFRLAAFNDHTFCVSYSQGDSTFVKLFNGGKVIRTYRFFQSISKIAFTSQESLVMVSNKNTLVILDTKSGRVVQNAKMKPEDYWQVMNPDVFQYWGGYIPASYFHPAYRSIETGFDYGYQFYTGIEAPDLVYQILDHYILIYDKELRLQDHSIYAKNIYSLNCEVVFIEPDMRFVIYRNRLNNLIYYDLKTHKTTTIPIELNGNVLDIIHPQFDEDLWVLSGENNKVCISKYALMPTK